MGKEEKCFVLWRERTPPSGFEENAGVGVTVTALPSPVTWDWILCEMSSRNPKTTTWVTARCEPPGRRWPAAVSSSRAGVRFTGAGTDWKSHQLGTAEARPRFHSPRVHLAKSEEARPGRDV